MAEIVIIGGGPAGLSAAVAAQGRGRQCLVISNPIQTNPLSKAPVIENYLGMPGVTGSQMLEQFRKQAADMGAQFVTGRVLSAVFMGDEICLTVGSEVYSCKKLILAGGIQRGAKYPGEEQFLGRGVSYCATCDGMLYRRKPITVIGRAKDAPLEANYLRQIGCQVTYLSPNQPEGLDPEIPWVKANRLEVVGQQTVTGVVADGAAIPCVGTFILRETVAPNDLFPDLAVEEGYIKVDRGMKTNLPHIFAAGDCTGKPLQISKAVGEGLIAGQMAAEELEQGV